MNKGMEAREVLTEHLPVTSLKSHWLAASWRSGHCYYSICKTLYIREEISKTYYYFKK